MANITPLRVGFVHPDLGIGRPAFYRTRSAMRTLLTRDHSLLPPIRWGREAHCRCCSLPARPGARGGHLHLETRSEAMFRRHEKRFVRQTIYTALFQELILATLGTLKVHVLGDSIVPRTILNSLHIVCASLRQIHLSLLLLASIYLPFRIPFISPLSPLESFDVFIVDQLSVCVPILRWFGQTRVVFYCHFPDKLLAGGREVEVDNVGRSDMNPREAKKKESRKAPGLLKRLYRLPFDKMEEATTGKSIRSLHAQESLADPRLHLRNLR
jgi:hypothetical protein